MAEKQETADDIIAEMLGARTEFPFVYLMGEPDTPEVIDPKTNKIIEPRKINIRRVTVKELADRLKAALRRERGDRAKLREALINVVKRLEAYVGCDHHTFHPTATTCDGITSVGRCGKIATCAAIFKARAALAAPPRNCDVGTAGEQTARFAEFCKSHIHSDLPKCAGCPLEGIPDGIGCAQAWAQMSYEAEKGGAK